MDMDESGRDIAYIENKRAKRNLWMRTKNGVYVLDVLVALPEHKKGNQSTNEGHKNNQKEWNKFSETSFHWQGR